LGDLDNAEFFYTEALRLKPGSVEALTNISELYTKKDDYQRALTFIEKALKREKGNPMIRYNRGEILLALGKLEEGRRSSASKLKWD
jgi:Flp pilus assembly protein TadD